jgi:hypothetical protein
MLFRMVLSFRGMKTQRLASRAQFVPMRGPWHRSRLIHSVMLEFSASSQAARNSENRLASAILELLPQLKSQAIRRFPQHSQETTAMVITSAHISPIIALIAGILILVMPRLLNLVVAIYLICVGLIGLGALKWLHM